MHQHHSPTSIRSRSTSITSDASPSLRKSSVAGTTLSPQKPAPAYVATAAASQLASDSQRLHTHGHGRDDEDALFTDRALALVNAFLDQLLYNFLASSRSTSLTSLKIAVEGVLKGKLARLAIESADEELRELLAEADEMSTAQTDQEETAISNLDMVFKRTRLRIMVYTRLGEMEDEDEETWLQQDEFVTEAGAKQSSSDSTSISWAGAIFLTSVLEYLAEECVEIAGEAGRIRLMTRIASTTATDSGDGSVKDRVVIEDHDVERIALNATLGRLWRTWRRTLRTPRGQLQPHSRSVSSVTSINTLRPTSPGHLLDSYDAQGRVSTSSAQRPQRNSGTLAQPSGDENQAPAPAPRLSSSSDEGPKTSRKRQKAYSDRPPSPDMHTATVNGYSTTENPAGVLNISDVNTNIEWDDPQKPRPESFPTPSETGSAYNTRPRLDGERAVVPISGVLHLHLPSSWLSQQRSRTTAQEDNIDRHDHANDHANNTSQAQHLSRKTSEHTKHVVGARQGDETKPDGVYASAQLVLKNKTPELGQRTWSSDVSHNYYPGASTSPGKASLRVRIPSDQGGGEYVSTNQTAKIFQTVQAQNIAEPDFELSTRNGSVVPPETPVTLSVPAGPHIATQRHVVSKGSPTSPPLTARPKEKNVMPVKGGILPREARVRTDSTRDLTDFIRSTAPDADQARVAPILISASSFAASTRKDEVLPTKTTSIGRQISTKTVDASNDRFVKPVSKVRQWYNATPLTSPPLGNFKSNDPVILPKVYKSVLEPREAVVRGRSSDDLVNFLRSGPPGADHPKPTPRESMERRTATKFVGNPDPNARRIKTPQMTPRLSESDTFRPAPAPRTKQAVPSTAVAAGTVPTTVKPTIATETTTSPSIAQSAKLLKSTRAKDPYAIDSASDTDNDILTSLPHKTTTSRPTQPKSESQSLIDFLNNTGPEPHQTATPIFTARPSTDSQRTYLTAPMKRSGTGSVKTTHPVIRSGIGHNKLTKSRPNSPGPEAALNVVGVESGAGSTDGSIVISTQAFGATAGGKQMTPNLGEFMSGGGRQSDLSLNGAGHGMELETGTVERGVGVAPVGSGRSEERAAPAPSVSRERKVKGGRSGVRGFFRKVGDAL